MLEYNSIYFPLTDCELVALLEDDTGMEVNANHNKSRLLLLSAEMF